MVTDSKKGRADSTASALDASPLRKSLAQSIRDGSVI